MIGSSYVPLSSRFGSLERARENVARTASFTRSGANAFIGNQKRIFSVFTNDGEMHRRADGRNVNGLNLRQVYGGGIRKRHSSHGYQSYRPNRYPGSSMRNMNDRPRVRSGLRGYLDRELDDYMGLRRKTRVELSSSDAAELRGRLDHEIDDYMSKRKELEKSRMEGENNVAAAAIADANGVSEAKRRDLSAELEAYLAEDRLDMAPDIIEAEVVEMVS